MLISSSFHLFTLVYTFHLCAVLILRWKINCSFVEDTNSSDNKKRIKVVKSFYVPKLNITRFKVVGVFFIVSLVLVPFTYPFPIVALAAVVLFFLFFGQILQLAHVRRTANVIPLVLLTIALSYWSNKNDWFTPEFTIKLIVSQLYFSAGFQKLKNTGFKWMNGKVLRGYLIEHDFWGDMPLAKKLAEMPKLCAFISGVTLLFELLFPIILIFPAVEIYFAVIGVFFHFGIGLLMRIHYLLHFGPVYWIFFINYLWTG